MRLVALVVLVAGLLVAGCGGGSSDDGAGARDALSGRVEADGSSTVQPFATAAAERFRREHPDVRITVGSAGTGGGFERFCRGETDLSNASRPIEDDEERLCAKNGVEHVEFQVANDALTVVVNRANDWVECLTVGQLQAIWRPGSKVTNWSQVPGASFPDVPLRLAGPGTDSGTFDYFTSEINGEEGASRTDYQASEDDNVIVQAVAGDKGGLGYFGLSYFEQNQDRLKALAVDGGRGCVRPGTETAQSGSYEPLSRPLFIYAKKDSFARPAVREFIRFTLDQEQALAEAALFVPLTADQLQKAKADFRAAVGAGA